VLLEFGVDAGKHAGVVQNQLAHKPALNELDGVKKERKAVCLCERLPRPRGVFLIYSLSAIQEQTLNKSKVANLEDQISIHFKYLGVLVVSQAEWERLGHKQ
jgi:hypothetical protein